jgi:hypothetical protein
MAAHISHGTPRRGISSLIYPFFVTLGCVATIYLAVLFLRPELLVSDSTDSGELEQQVADLKREVVRGFADIEPVRQTVGEVRMDVDNLKAAVEESSDRDRILMEKVAALENSAKERQRAAPEANESAGATGAIPPRPQPDPRKAAAAKAAKPAPRPAKPKEASAVRSAPAIETGSIDTAAKAPAPKPAKSPIGVLLATGPSVDALRLNWSILTDRHADAVKNLNPRYVVSGNADDRSYGLVAGPVGSTTEAANVCKVMEKRGVPCEISLYRGNAL